MAKVFDKDGFLTTSVQYDEAEDTFVVGSHQNVAPVMDDLAERNNDGTGGFSKSRDIRHLAKIPLALYDEWMREAYLQNIPVYHKQEKDAFLKRKLAAHNKLTVSGKATGRLGFTGEYGNQQWSAAFTKG